MCCANNFKAINSFTMTDRLSDAQCYTAVIDVRVNDLHVVGIRVSQPIIGFVHIEQHTGRIKADDGRNSHSLVGDKLFARHAGYVSAQAVANHHQTM